MSQVKPPPGETLRGTVLFRITRPDRQAYVARAQLADGRVTEAIFDTFATVPLGRCIIAPESYAMGSVVGVDGVWYPTRDVSVLSRGEVSASAPGPFVRHHAADAAGRLGLAVEFTEEPNGVWVVRVVTNRGTVEIPQIPGESWPETLEATGLMDTV